MRLNKLLHDALEMWPSEIDISDGYHIPNVGYRFNKLIAIWNEIELQAQEKGEWLDLMTWIVYQSILALSIKYLTDNIQVITNLKDVVSEAEIEERLIENLKMPGYEQMLQEYLLSN